MSPARGTRTPVAAVVLAWVVVAVPLGWGLFQSVMKSRPLFSGQSAVTAPSTTPAVK